MNIKNVLFDIDGTLINNNLYPQNFNEIKNEILRLQSKNISFGVCTYRPYDDEVKKIMKDYKINGDVISEGGACFYQKGKSITNPTKTIISEVENINLIISKKFKRYIEKGIIKINEKRVMTATIYVFKAENIAFIFQKLKKIFSSNEYEVKISLENKNKLLVTPKKNGKIYAIKKYLDQDEVILISDYENEFVSHDKNIKVYSVGNNGKFNAYADEVFEGSGIGIEKILLKLGEE